MIFWNLYILSKDILSKGHLVESTFGQIWHFVIKQYKKRTIKFGQFKLNVILTKYLFDQMSFWPNVLLTKCPFNQMSFWPNVLLTNCPFDKYPFDQISFWPNILSTKCSFDQMSFQPNVLSTKCLSTNCTGEEQWERRKKMIFFWNSDIYHNCPYRRYRSLLVGVEPSDVWTKKILSKFINNDTKL